MLIGVMFMFCLFSVKSQESYQYLLKADFHGQPSVAPDLVQVPNNLSQTGEFVNRIVPSTTCGQQGNAPGYFFEDDAGLVFYNPAGFINQSYSIAFNFHFDEFISPPQWVRVMSFTHTDDVGIYILLTNPPQTGTLEFWPFSTVGPDDFFNVIDFYQMILVRNDTGLIRIYVNGSEFAQYDDGNSQAYVPQPPNNYIIWFRDDPSVLANEASPGFVSDIRISNFAWSPDDVQQAWEKFCSSLLSVPDPVKTEAQIYPNPASDLLWIKLPAGIISGKVSLYDVTGKIVQSREQCRAQEMFDIRMLTPGIYLVRIEGYNFVGNYRFLKK